MGKYSVRPYGVIPALQCCCSLRAYPDLSCDLGLLLPNVACGRSHFGVRICVEEKHVQFTFT